jgi:thymidylate synthase
MMPMMILVAGTYRCGTNDDPELIFDRDYEDFTVEGYDPHPAIKALVAV